MLLSKGLQTLFIALFALLQCVAPLVHAHVDGANSDAAAHAHELRLHAPVQTDAYFSFDYVQQADAAVIELPHELQRNDSLMPDQAPVTKATFTSQPDLLYIYRSPAHHKPQLPPPGRYVLPDAQAPPSDSASV